GVQTCALPIYHATYRSLPVEVGRLTSQHLPAPLQGSAEFGQSRAGTRRDDELGGVVGHYAGVSGNVQHRKGVLHGTTQKCFGATTRNADSFSAADRFAHTLQKHLTLVLSSASIEPFHLAHQNRSNSGNGSSPLWTCIAPNSAQRCRVGMFLPGLSSPSSSKAALIS